jgi:hypothetical protein
MDALFPDRIDLGYSYLSVIALLSLILHHPDDQAMTLHEEGIARNLREHFEAGILAARVILDRECLRLVPDCPRSETLSSHTLLEARLAILSHSETARSASRRINDMAVTEHTQQWRQKMEAATRNEIKRRIEIWNAEVRKVSGDDSGNVVEVEPRNIGWRDAGTDWILPELDRRAERVLEIIDTADNVPAYALNDTVKYENMLDAFPVNSRYNEEVNRQIEAQELWTRNERALR